MLVYVPAITRRGIYVFFTSCSRLSCGIYLRVVGKLMAKEDFLFRRILIDLTS